MAMIGSPADAAAADPAAAPVAGVPEQAATCHDFLEVCSSFKVVAGVCNQTFL